MRKGGFSPEPSSEGDLPGVTLVPKLQSSSLVSRRGEAGARAKNASGIQAVEPRRGAGEKYGSFVYKVVK